METPPAGAGERDVRIAVACGGTGGHIFPGLATAQELMRRGHDVTLWLAGKDVERSAVQGWDGAVVTVPAQGFPSGISFASGVAAIKLVRAVNRVKADLKQQRPDVVLAMGSYASVGPVGAALRLGIPFVLHESNVVPGRAVRLFSRWAAAVAGCFDETRFYLRRRPLVLTGMPLRRDLLDVARQPAPPRGEGFSILVMGGSRGAHALNTLATEALIQARQAGESLTVTHLTGESDYSAVQARYAEAGLPAEVLAFTREIGRVYAATDVAICRSGAATCAELSAFGLPSLLVPYPHAIHDHQTANAQAMEKSGAADLVPEQDLTVEWLVSYIRQMLRQRERRLRMAEAARARASGNGAERLSDLVEQVARGEFHAPR
ncbi:MAG TPA: undecaprenyldiphospho-muramoylpentapeptide beta-N-acetylglucosaminyltransferase [Kiritimatiellia bacterium]|nr:undecaprenyldiphospho-muramoylpentapeptide beta-N-acetylglucosaminyltransferase [Kiritimatiellia bacterium]